MLLSLTTQTSAPRTANKVDESKLAKSNLFSTGDGGTSERGSSWRNCKSHLSQHELQVETLNYKDKKGHDNKIKILIKIKQIKKSHLTQHELQVETLNFKNMIPQVLSAFFNKIGFFVG